MSTFQSTLQLIETKTTSDNPSIPTDMDCSSSTNSKTFDNSPTINRESSSFTTETEELRLRTLCEEAIAEKTALSVEVKALYEKINDLNYKLFQAARHKEALNKANIEISELKQKIEEITQENQQLKLQTDGSLDKLISEERYDEMEATATRYRGLLENNITEIEDLNNTVQRLQANNGRLQVEKTDLKDKLEFALNTLNGSEEGKEDLWETIERLETENKKLKLSLENSQKQAQEKISVLLETNHNLEMSLQMNTQELEQIKSELIESKRQSQQSEMINDSLQRLVNESYQQIHQLKLDISEKDGLLTTTVEKANNVQRILRQVVQENEVYKANIQSLQAEYVKVAQLASPKNNAKKRIELPEKKDANKEIKAKKIWADELERKILSLLDEKKKLTREHNQLLKTIQEKRKEADKLNKGTRKSTLTSLNKTTSESQVNVSLLLTEWDEEETQASSEEEVACVLTELEIPADQKGSFVVFRGAEIPADPKSSFVVFRGDEIPADPKSSFAVFRGDEIPADQKGSFAVCRGTEYC